MAWGQVLIIWKVRQALVSSSSVNDVTGLVDCIWLLTTISFNNLFFWFGLGHIRSLVMLGYVYMYYLWSLLGNALEMVRRMADGDTVGSGVMRARRGVVHTVRVLLEKFDKGALAWWPFTKMRYKSPKLQLILVFTYEDPYRIEMGNDCSCQGCSGQQLQTAWRWWRSPWCFLGMGSENVKIYHYTELIASSSVSGLGLLTE